MVKFLKPYFGGLGLELLKFSEIENKMVSTQKDLKTKLPKYRY